MGHQAGQIALRARREEQARGLARALGNRLLQLDDGGVVTSSPSGALTMACNMAGDGRVTVSLRKSIMKLP